MPHLDHAFNGDKTVAALVSATIILLFASGLTVMGMAIFASFAESREHKKAATFEHAEVNIDVSRQHVSLKGLMLIPFHRFLPCSSWHPLSS